MRLITLIFALVITTATAQAGTAHAGTAQAEQCRIPSKQSHARKVSEYRIRQGDIICLSSGSKLVARRVLKGSVTFGIKGIRGESSKRLDTRTVKSAKVASYRLRLKNSQIHRSASSIITVEVTELNFEVSGPNPGPSTPPRACAQMEGACTLEFAPVCGVDLNGDFREYSNACQAAADCAELVESSLC